MSAEGGTKTVVTALVANTGIAIAKFVAFLFTTSSSMLAEAVHSVADAGNQGLLLLGGKRAKRDVTPEHPFGYGRERYFYAFMVAIVLFTLGSGFALYEGWHKITDPHPVKSPAWAYGVLIVAIVFESFALRTAVKESNRQRGGSSWIAFVRRAKAPELPVVLLEDTGALTGLVFALTGITLAVLTGNPVWDGVGTMSIGVLLGVIAIVLALETKSMLIGEGARPEVRQRIRAALADGPEFIEVIHMQTLHLGPEELLVAAKLAVPAEATAGGVATGIDAAERRVRDAVPIARVIYLEPELRTEAGLPPR